MCGISNQFIRDYKSLKGNDNKLNAQDLKQLSNLIINSAGSSASIKDLQKEIMADGRLDDEEKKLLLTIGFSVDAESLQTIKSNLMPPSDEAISNLLNKGFSERSQAIKTYEKENPNITKARDSLTDAGNTVIRGIKFITPDWARKGANWVMGRDNSKSEVKFFDTAQASIYNDAKTMNRFFNEENLRVLSASERTDCVDNALRSVGVITNKQNLGSVEINEGSLKKMTGKDWDAVNVAHYKNNPNQMKSLLNGQEGKAILTVGAHTFVFQGFDTQGNLKVTDPSERNIPRLINKDNPSATVFIQKENGKGGDGAKSNKASNEAAAVGFNTFKANNNDSKINSADRADRSGESFNIRKLLVLVGDKGQASVSRKIFEAIEKNDLQTLVDTLTSNGISLQPQEAKAFINMMKTKVKSEDGKQTNMLDALKNLGNQSASAQAKYLNGVEYSDISLKDYFTKTNPQTIFNTFQDMIHGRDGC